MNKLVRRIGFVALVAALGGAAVGCGSSHASGTANGYSCDRRSSKDADDADSCIDFSDTAIKKGDAYMKSACHDPVYVFAHAPCPKDKLVATCESKLGKNLFRYYSGGKNAYTVAAATDHCTKMYGGRIL